MRVLIVEDVPSMRHFLRLLLREFGRPQVDEAGDGEQALRMLKANTYDLVLLDLTLPRLSGFEVLTCLRDREVDQKTPVLIVSASYDQEIRNRATALNASILGKPLQAFQLRDAVRDLLDLPAPKPTPGQERRKSPRLQVPIDISFDGGGLHLDLLTHDISTTGAFFVADKWKPVGTKGQVTIRPPHIPTPLTVDCEVVHIRLQAIGSAPQGFGVRFLPGSNELRDRLRHIFFHSGES